MNAYNIKSKEQWGFFIIAPLFILIASVIGELYFRNFKHNKDTDLNIERLATAIDESSYSYALKNLQSLASLSYLIETAKGDIPPNNEKVTAGLLAIRGASDAEMAYLMNIHGEVIASTIDTITGLSFIGNNFSFRPYFSEVVQKKEPKFYPALGVVSLKRGLYFGVPVFDSLKSVAGVLALKMGVGAVEKTLREDEGTSVVVSQDGIIYASSKESWLFKSIKKLSTEHAYELKQSKQFANEEIEYLGFDLLSGSLHLEKIQYKTKKHGVFYGEWSVVKLYEPAHFNVKVFLLFLVGLFIFLSGFYFAFNISAKLKKMNYLAGKQKRYSQRIFRQQEAIIYLNKSNVQLKNWDSVKGLITETVSKVLNAERSSIWLFSDNGSSLVCDDRFVKSRNNHESGQELNEATFPNYFQKLKNEETIVSNNVFEDANLHELKELFKDKQICSIIHIPILHQGNPTGVICIEHSGKQRAWNTDERVFCERVANRISLFLIVQRRRKISEELHESNNNLKKALEVAQRSRELEIANEKLIKNESVLQEAFYDIKQKQIELTKLNKELELSNQQANKLNNELVEANSLLAHQKAEVLNTLQELKATQSQLIQSEKMASVGVLTAGIAHEINNPLNFIQGGKTALEMHVYDNYSSDLHDFKPMFEMIETGVERATEIIKSLNHFNRKSEVFTEVCSLHTILDNCLVMLHNQIKYKIKVEKNYTNKYFCLIGNEGKLHQVFLNIIANAEQAILDNGLIKIKTHIEDKHINILIEDNGTGIKEEHKQRILDPFFTTKAPGKGTGLGLSIALNIIQEHNGYVNFESEEGKGTHVLIKLPIKKDSIQ